MPVDKEEARPFRQNGSMFNQSELHPTNCKIRGINIMDICPKELSNLREKEKERLSKITTKMKKESTDLTTFKVEDETEFESWYRPIRNIPLRLVQDEVKPAIFPNNEDHVLDHRQTCIDTIEKFLKSGAIKLMPKEYKPKLSATFVLANANSQHKAPRACYDGGPFKVIKLYGQYGPQKI